MSNLPLNYSLEEYNTILKDLPILTTNSFNNLEEDATTKLENTSINYLVDIKILVSSITKKYITPTLKEVLTYYKVVTLLFFYSNNAFTNFFLGNRIN